MLLCRYMNVLKEELAKSSSQQTSNNMDYLCKNCSHNNGETSSYHAKLEQTILTLRRVVERLKVENNNLREGKSLSSQNGSAKINKELYDKLKRDFDKVQQDYTDALNRVSALQVELELLANQPCPKCKAQESPDRSSDDQSVDDLQDKLRSKTQLLEKAKILLTRAAAKERNLKETISMLRRKCSDLQNVPVIDEISE